MLIFHFISIFPEAFSSYLGESILKRAQAKRLVKFDFVDPRRFAKDRHQTVDDKPFGGGPGMVMKIEPIYQAVAHIKQKTRNKKTRVVLFSTRGKVFDQKTARRLAKYNHLIFICGRYEGVDERVAEYVADEEISIGDFVLSGGELPALVVAEAVARQIPGVLGKQESLEEIKGSYPVYTRPPKFFPEKFRRTSPPMWKPKGVRGKGWRVPAVLLSGDHKKIAEWRKRRGSSTARKVSFRT